LTKNHFWDISGLSQIWREKFWPILPKIILKPLLKREYVYAQWKRIFSPWKKY
jgi:hypothetical protein